ncbi:uncharacterized protein LOC120135341 [Hibiscus syriacus]|uniref:uncharacterized protein LOC120135341 n=1 Tax=Hibiscus syriacus TaxID=106335 RepID=UPI00192152E4|nr:uncharacterized protein LOC120135341 [Hibiscus syriacus]XP_039007550.1 uncharacterized protein LOC120135341 [Hibiscus syriacus]
MGIQKIWQWKSGVSSCHGWFPVSLKGEGKEKEHDDPLKGANSGDDLDDCDFEGIGCELGMVEGQICSIPYELFDLPDLREILSLETWNSCLTEEEWFSLSAYLPDMDEWTFWLTMKDLFSGSDFYFGNPVATFFKRLRSGFYPPKISRLRDSLQFLERRKYYHAIRSYHHKMVQMFIDMGRLWDECDISVGIPERFYMWRTRMKCGDANTILLDLNAVPSDGYLLTEDVNPDAVMPHLPKRMKIWDSVKEKANVASASANGMNTILPNCSTKGVLEVKTTGSATHSYNQKMVVDDLLEQIRPVPKGLLKVVPKVPYVLLQVSKVFSRRSQKALHVGAQNLQVRVVPNLPAPAYMENAGNFSGPLFLWEKVSGGQMNPEQSRSMLIHQDSALRSRRYLQDSSESRSKEVDIADLGKHKLFELDDESVIDSKGYKFDQNMGHNLDMGKKGLFSYPFTNQYHEGERHTRIMQKECMAILPRVPGAVSGSGIEGGMQDKLMAFPNQMKNPSDFKVEITEKPSKPSGSEIKYDTHPLTYKRRKPQAKNSPGFTNSLITGTDISSVNPN